METKKTASKDAVFKLTDAGRLIRPGSHCYWVDVDPASFAVETHVPVNQSENRVVLAEPNIFTGRELGPALADDDVACDDGFAAKLFDTKSLAVTVAPVLD